jgi:hypothetical protein
MRTAVLVVCSAVFLLLAACSDTEEDVSADPQSSEVTTTTTPAPVGDVIICARFGDGSTPTTATPVPSCTPAESLPGDSLEDAVQIAEGVWSRRATPSPLPEGAVALTDFFEFEFAGEPIGATIGLPLHVTRGAEYVPTTVPPGMQATWYTHEQDGWTRLMNAVIRNGGDEPLAEGTFPELPANIIVLAEAE